MRPSKGPANHDQKEKSLQKRTEDMVGWWSRQQKERNIRDLSQE